MRYQIEEWNDAAKAKVLEAMEAGLNVPHPKGSALPSTKRAHIDWSQHPFVSSRLAPSICEICAYASNAPIHVRVEHAIGDRVFVHREGVSPKHAFVREVIFDVGHPTPRYGVEYDDHTTSTELPQYLSKSAPIENADRVRTGERAKRGTCKLPPPGWFCTLADGHTGSCPTWPIENEDRSVERWASHQCPKCGRSHTANTCEVAYAESISFCVHGEERRADKRAQPPRYQCDVDKKAHAGPCLLLSTGKPVSIGSRIHEKDVAAFVADDTNWPHLLLPMEDDAMPIGKVPPDTEATRKAIAEFNRQPTPKAITLTMRSPSPDNSPSKARINAVANVMIAEWERVEPGEKVNVSRIATYADMARAAIEHLDAERALRTDVPNMPGRCMKPIGPSVFCIDSAKHDGECGKRTMLLPDKRYLLNEAIKEFREAADRLADAAGAMANGR